jgi:hypothetical protein
MATEQAMTIMTRSVPPVRGQGAWGRGQVGEALQTAEPSVVRRYAIIRFVMDVDVDLRVKSDSFQFTP